MIALRHNFRRAGLTVPQHELGQVVVGRIGEAGDELVDRRSAAVMTREVKVHAGPKPLRSQQGLEHAHDFGALLVDGGGVEIADFPVHLGPHRMSERPRVLHELVAAQRPHVRNPLHRPRADVGGEFLIAKNRQALLEAELEPVAAGDAVAGPVVEILVRDDRLDAHEVLVGRRVA